MDSPGPRLRKNEAVIEYEVGEDGLMLYDPSSRYTHVLDEIGAFVWRAIDGNRNLQALLSLVLETYEADDAEMVRHDIEDYFRELERKGLVLRPD